MWSSAPMATGLCWNKPTNKDSDFSLHIFKIMTTQHAPGANDTTPAHNTFPFIFQCHPFSCRKVCVEDRKRASLIVELILFSGNMFRACWLRTRCSSADSLFPVVKQESFGTYWSQKKQFTVYTERLQKCLISTGLENERFHMKQQLSVYHNEGNNYSICLVQINESGAAWKAIGKFQDFCRIGSQKHSFYFRTRENAIARMMLFHSSGDKKQSWKSTV